MLGSFNVPLLATDSTKRKSARKLKKSSTPSIEKTESTFYPTLHSTTGASAFLLSAQDTYPEKDRILGHKTKLDKFKSTEIIESHSLNTMESKQK